METNTHPPRRSLVAELVVSLKDMISKNIYRIGHKLPTERQLLLEMGVSRTVIREAISRLSAEGWVKSRQGSGVYVLPRPQKPFQITVNELSEVHDYANLIELRLAVETEMAGLAALRRTQTDIDSLQTIHAAMKEAVEAGGVGVREDIEFHKCLALSTHNSYFLRFITFLGEHLVPHWSRDVEFESPEIRAQFLKDALFEHSEIISAVIIQDEHAARNAARRHLNQAEARRLHSPNNTAIV